MFVGVEVPNLYPTESQLRHMRRTEDFFPLIIKYASLVCVVAKKGLSSFVNDLCDDVVRLSRIQYIRIDKALDAMEAQKKFAGRMDLRRRLKDLEEIAARHDKGSPYREKILAYAKEVYRKRYENG